jgi:hypothetical protein
MWKKLTALYALISTACASWQTQRGPAPRAVEESAAKGEETIRVELKSGTRWEIYAAKLVGDSIIGRNTPVMIPETQRIAVATADVKSVSRHKFSAGRTILAVAAITVAVVAIVGAAASSGSSSSSTSNSSCGSSTA